MVKRSSYADDPSRGASSSKRARTADSDEDDEDMTIEMPHQQVKRENDVNGHGRKKNKARRGNQDEDSEEDEDGEGDDEEVPDEDQNAETFENEHREKILADLEEKRKVQGGIAEFGIIEKIEMFNFMCHKYLTFDFGPQINFIIGHNGSGKSAVLSAITVALGGKSASTGRGSGLKSFIKEGNSQAEVIISLKNQGEEAFKPKEYGKTIIVSRRFTKEGGSTWKIKNVHGAVISQKREELAAICDHMNIQVDNPMNVLTQDAARQFLSASSSADKYKFFLRGTQLSQLSTEYEICFSNVQKTNKVLAQKKEAIPDLKQACREATIRFDEAEKAREQKQKADELKKELAWAHVRTKEEEMEERIKEAVKLEGRLPRLREYIEDAEARKEAAGQEVEMYQAEAAALGDIGELTRERAAIQVESKDNKAKISDFNADQKRMDQSMNYLDQQIKELDDQIAAENERMAAHTQAKHDEMQRKIAAAREAVEVAEANFDKLRLEADDQSRKNDDIKQKGLELEPKVKELQGSIKNCEGMIERAKQAQKNTLVPYGKNIREVLQQIEGMRWQGDKPLGPLGMYVKAKDAKTWGHLLRSQLAGFLTAFAVTNGPDQAALKKLLAKYGNLHTQIIICEKDLFDFSSGEPPENYLTVLRALEINDPHVLRILIDRAHIERQILAHTRRDGQDQLRSLRGGNAWTNDKFSVRVFPEGGVASQPLNIRPQNDATSLLLTEGDPASQISRHQQELDGYTADYKKVHAEEAALKDAYMKGRKLHEGLTRQARTASEDVRRAKSALTTLQQEASDDLPMGAARFQDAKQEAEEEKQNIQEQFKVVAQQKSELGERQKILLSKSNDLKARIGDFNNLKEGVGAKVQEAVDKRMKANNDKEHYQSKLDKAEEEWKKAQVIADVVQVEFTSWTEKAQEFCARVENPRKVDTVQRHLEGVQKALADREKRHGATVEEMAIELNKAKERLEKAESDLREMSKLNKAIKNSLTVRLSRWQEFRRHIALRCKFVFAYHLSQRGYYGKVMFNHEQQTLILKVQTDDQVGTQTSREKDPKSLSGGEKSFSTICLLLSLWESIGCPLRCLDEFDVFMDAVNRRISMRMMIETANSSDKKQYILITPQDMGNVQLGKTVTVNRMIDPERAQPRN